MSNTETYVRITLSEESYKAVLGKAHEEKATISMVAEKLIEQYLGEV